MTPWRLLPRVRALLDRSAMHWCLLLLAGWASTGAATVLTLTQAQGTVSVNGETHRQNLELPYHWDRANPGQQGEAVFNFDFELAETPQDVWGIYLPRLGNAYEVWLNGTMLQRNGDAQAYNGSDYARVPRYITVDSAHFEKTNRIRVLIRADVGRRGGLAPLLIGPQDQVYPLYEKDHRWRVTGSVAVAAFCFVVGLTALALWSTFAGPPKSGRTGRDPLYFFAALAQLALAVSVGDVLVENPLLPWPWWGMVQVVAVGLWGCSMALACMEIARWGLQPWAQPFRRWLMALMLVCPVMAWSALGFGRPMALTVWYGVFEATLLIFTAAFLWSALRPSHAEQRMVAVAAAINIGVAVRDLYVFRIDPAYGINTWLRYSSVLFGLALGYVVLLRFRATSAQLHDLLGTLASRVSEKEEALRETYAKLELLARQQERTAERGRILRNMHDGVGAHISSAMRQLQANADVALRPARDEVLLTLRDALDQLKLSIDSIHLAAGDVTALLANLRYRLGPRFTAMGIDLQWDVDLLPLCPGLDASAMSELQFMLFAALSNVLQHAHAGVLRIEGHAQGQSRIFVRVVDDGCGFDPQADQRKGLATMRERAVSIGARLHISSRSGKTVVEIQLDV